MNAKIAQGTNKRVGTTLLAALSVGVVLLSAGCGGGDDGGSRPTATAIVASLAGADLAADLTTAEVQCFARELHDGGLSSATLTKLVTGTNGNLTAAELVKFDAAARSAADDCGFIYVSPRS